MLMGYIKGMNKRYVNLTKIKIPTLDVQLDLKIHVSTTESVSVCSMYGHF